jgi:GT2 family glycosyltransferase
VFFRKDVFSKYGLFDERLVRNQDIEFNKRIKNNGGKLFIIPEVKCTYFARETFGGLFENNFKNGYWNILTVFFTKTLKSLSLRHFLPLIFVLSLVIPPLAAIFYFPFIYLSVISLSLYLLFSFLISFKLSIAKNLSFINLFTSFLVLHFSYGLGSLVSIIKLPLLGTQKNA